MAEDAMLQVGVLAGSEPSHGVALLIRAMRRSAQLRATVHCAAQPTTLATSPQSAIGERLFRRLDRMAFGDVTDAHRDAVCDPAPPDTARAALWLDLRDASSASHTTMFDGALRLSVTFDDQPAARLVEAVRHRLGREGDTVAATIWIEGAEGAMPLLVAHCCLEHRSLSRSLRWVAAKLPSLVVGAWRRLQMASPVALASQPVSCVPRSHSPATLTSRLLGAACRRLLWRDQWLMQVHRADDADPGRPGELLATLEPPATAFWADPFVLARGGRHWVFFEELPFATGRGHISVLELDASGRPTGEAAQPALIEPWHLSYPFLWQEDESLYMIPESSAHRSVDLYVCENFPARWRKLATLIEGPRLADATLVRHGGRLWLFATHAEVDGCLYDELHVYWAERLHGPWHAHAANPVKIDARAARPAGAMWSHAGRLFRPVQDCSATYGGAVSVQEVIRLDEVSFEEREAWRIAAPGPRAGTPLHTLNSAGGFTVIDRLRLRWRMGSICSGGEFRTAAASQARHSHRSASP
jgi:hypothetical protein